jgi:hypothetical protein
MKFKIMSASTVAVSMLLLLSVSNVGAAVEIEPNTILSSKDNFGSSVAVYGHTAMVGAYGDNKYAGKVYAFDNINGWTQSGSITPLGIAPNDYFGRSIDIFGNIAVIGADGTDIDLFPEDLTNDLISNAGAVYLFDSGTLQEIKLLTASDAQRHAAYGASVGIFDRFVIVGSPGAHGDMGAAYIYEKPSTGWVDLDKDIHVEKILAPNGGIEDYFGTSVAISDRFAVVGSYGNDGVANRAGAVYVYEKMGDDSWSVPAELPLNAGNFDPDASPFQADDKLGMSVAIDGNLIAAGAPGPSGARGKVFLFRYESGQWSIAGELQPTAAELDELQVTNLEGFGTSVSVQGNYLAVGAENGPAFIYTRAGTGEWTLDKTRSPFGYADGNGSVSEVDIAASSGGAYQFWGGMPDRNANKGAAFNDEADVLPTGETVANTPPKIFAINDQIMSAGGSLALDLSLWDLETLAADLKILQPSVTDSSLLTFPQSFPLTGTSNLTINSVAGGSGTVEVTVAVEDTCTENMDTATCPSTGSTSFNLTVGDIPEIVISDSTPGPYVINEGQETFINVMFSIVSPEYMQGGPTVTSSNQELIPNSNLSLSENVPNEYTLTIEPNAQEFGASQITIKATSFDGIEVTETLLVSVNGLPIISNLPNKKTVSVDEVVGGALDIPFSVADAETHPSELEAKVTVESDPDDILTATPPFVEKGDTANDRVLYIPWPDDTLGAVELSVTVDDGSVTSAPSPLSLQVVSTTDTIIDSITVQGTTENLLDKSSSERIVSLNEGEGSIALDIVIEDGDEQSIDDIVRTVTSTRSWASDYELSCFPPSPSTPSLFPCELWIAEPAATADTSLDSTVTISVDDGDMATAGDRQSFILSYNTRPTIDPAEGETFPDGVTIEEDIDENADGLTDTQIFNFSIGDDSTEPAKLTKNFTSSNNQFLNLAEDTAGNYPFTQGCADINSYNCWTCDGGDCQLRIKPALNDHGSAVISAEVTDAGGLSAGISFNMTVTAVNDPPGLIIKDGSEEVSAVTMKENNSAALDIISTDVDEDSLTLDIESLNTDLIPNEFANIKICEVSEVSDPFDPESATPPDGWICFDRSEYALTPDATGNYSTLKLFIRPAENANSELLKSDGSVIGAGNINVSATDPEGATVDKNIKATVEAADSAPVIDIQSPFLRMFDDRDRTTAEANPIVLSISHPDGRKEVTISVELHEDETCGTECPIPITSQNSYFIDSNGSIINNTVMTDEIQPGETLSLDLVLKPVPNVIKDVMQEKLKVIVSNADDGTLSTSEMVIATVEPVNDAPTISGLKENYPCLNCDVESPWLQEMSQTINFTVADPDPQDDPSQLTVTAKWGQKDGADIDPTGEYTPAVIEGPTSDGQVSLLVVPPDTGRLPLTITVIDAAGPPYPDDQDNEQDTHINVQEAPPEIEPYPDEFDLDLSAKEDGSTEVDLLVSDIETDDLSQLTLVTAWRSITPEMPEGTFSGGEISSGGLATLTVIPPADWPRGADETAVAEIDVTAREPDGVRSETITFTLTIEATPDAPVLTSAKPLDPAPIISEGGTYVIDFWIEDIDTRIDTLNIEPLVTGLDLSLSAFDCPINDPYLKRCEWTVKSPEQSFGDSTITITAAETNPPYLEGSLVVPLTVQENNEAPSFSIVGANPFSAFVVDPNTGEKSIATEEGTIVTVNYELSDPDGPTEGLQVVPESLQWIWTASTTPTEPVELELIAQGNSIQITPSQNGFGEGSVLLQVTDGTNSVSTGFDVTLAPKNDPPTVTFTNPPQEPLAESGDNKTLDLELSISDVETDSSAMTPTFTVEWVEDGIRETLIAEDHILATGIGEIRTVKFTRPDICSETGATAIITVRVTDGDSADPKIDTDQVAIEYTAVDFPPTIRKKNGLYFESIKENSGPHFVDFVVAKEPACRPAELVMTMPVITGDPELLPEGNYYFDPNFTGATRRLWLEPAQNKWGTVDITVSVLDALTPDQLQSDPLTFSLRVVPVTHAPTISVLMRGDSPAQVYQVEMDESETTEGMGYVIEVEDLDTLSEELILGAIWAPVSGREDEFVEGDIRFEGTGSERSVIITPEPYENGYAKITPWVKDSAESTPVKSQPFVLHVRPVNDPPVINAPIANPDDIVFVQGDETYTLRFQVYDRDSVLPSNSVSAESGNTALLPQNDVTRFDWGRIENPQDNMTHYIEMKPYPIIDEEFKDIPVTIKASDGTDQSTFPFTLRVVRNANPPQITIRPSVSVWEDQVEEEVVDFKVTDEEKDPQDLDVFVSSGDTRFIPNSSIEVEYIGGADVNWRLRFRPAADAPFDEGDSYTIPLIISAYNDFFEAVTELSVTIYNRNDAPEIVNITKPETVYLNEPFEIFFEVYDRDEGPDDLELTASSTDLSDAVYEFSPEIGTSRTLKVFPNISSPDQRSIDITITVTDNSGVVSPTNGVESNYTEETVTIYMAGAAPGDVDGSGIVDLGDAIAALQVLSGIQPGVLPGADVNGDGRIGLAEAFNALTHVASQ